MSDGPDWLAAIETEEPLRYHDAMSLFRISSDRAEWANAA